VNKNNNELEPAGLRHDWTAQEIEAMLLMPLTDLVYRAQTVHRQHHPEKTVQLSSLLSIKTGGCKEDCSYCSQSAHHMKKTKLVFEPLMPLGEVLAKARQAKEAGATRFCMGAAWREVREGEEFERVIRMVEEVNAVGLETCVTLGMLNEYQAKRLKEAGLAYYNHNLDTSPEFYGEIVTTRSYQDRLDTIQHVQQAGISVCSGGIIGMGETLARGHAAGRQGPAGGRPVGRRAHDRRGAHHHAGIRGAALRRPPQDEPRGADPVPDGRRQLYLLRRPPAHHRKRRGER